MTQSSFPFDNQEVTETQFSELFRNLQDTGVIGSSSLEVSADSSGLNVKVAAGPAFIRGHYYDSTALERPTIATGESAARIDTICLRLDPGRNSIEQVIVKGVASVNPTPPTLTQTSSGIYELPLADVAVAANAVTIPASAVKDRRAFTSARVGRWATDQRPTSPQPGQMGLNTTRRVWEFYNGADWLGMAAWSADSGLDGRTITVSRAAPSNSQGANGDIWFEVIG